MIYQTHLLVTKILTISKKVTVYCYSETRENIYNYLILSPLPLFLLKITSLCNEVFMERELDTVFVASYLFDSAAW